MILMQESCSLQTALHRLVASPTKKAAGNETLGAALVVKEVAGNVVEASHEPEQLNEIVGFEDMLRQTLNWSS